MRVLGRSLVDALDLFRRHSHLSVLANFQAEPMAIAYGKQKQTGSVSRSLQAPLSPRSADLIGNLRLHRLSDDHRHRLAQEIAVLGVQGLGDFFRIAKLLLSAIVVLPRQSIWSSTDESGEHVRSPWCEVSVEPECLISAT
jgi:hypothetical protein